LTSTISDDDRKRIKRLFLRFAAIYGHVWKSNYKSEHLLEVTKEEWAVNLKPFNNQIIKEVLIDCTQHLNLPPTLPQFIGKCATIEKRNSGYFTKHVSTKMACPEVAEFNLKKIREILLK
jgi:hypothetical protein